jgi:hypothetical protein
LQIDLQHGRVKACCKTPFQEVTAQELASEGQRAIFNSAYMIERRAEMLRGVKHPDCAACWKAEDLGVESYRQAQSVKPMFRDVAEQVGASRRLDGAVPRHVEVILRTTCDLACSYCGPDFSNRWEKEIEHLGPYPHDGGIAPRPVTAGTPPGFTENFHEWLSGCLDEVSYIQFNGGEPLIQEDFYRFAEMILTSDSDSHIKLGVITNLNTPPARLRQLIELLPSLHERHGFRFGISFDAIGSRAEYIRNGLRWERFDANLRTLLGAVPDLDIQLAPTMSALNVSSAPDIIRYAASIQSAYRAHITFRPSMVMWPDFQSPLILLPDDYRWIDEATRLLEQAGAWPNLRQQLMEIKDAARRVPDPGDLRGTFHRWFTEYDYRRKTDFISTFPELADFWDACARAGTGD